MEIQSIAKWFGTGRLAGFRHWGLTLALGLGLLAAGVASAAPLSLTVLGVRADGSTLEVQSGFRWTVEEDATKLSVPGLPATKSNYSFSFHTSYMPVVATGRVGDTTRSELEPRRADPDYERLFRQSLPELDASKRYYVSVAAEGYQMGGAPVVFGANGASATVYVNQYKLPAAQLSVFAFNDNNPINGAPDLPQETGLAGFTVQLFEAGGTYGQSGGAVTQDGFGNPLGTTYDAQGNVLKKGSGIVLTGRDGTAVIKNLFPAKYTVVIVPPAHSDWHQTSTIEGTRGSDAWVKNNEPSFFQEFGPPGHHVFIGFTRSGKLPIFTDNRTEPSTSCAQGVPGCVLQNRLNGSRTIEGRIVNVHNSRTPNYAFEKGAPVPECWVGLNETGAGTRALFATPCRKDSSFTIPNVPNGTYELVVWDDPLDMIIATQTVTVNGANVRLGDVPVFSWFGRYQGRVFQDIDGTGLPFFKEAFNKPHIKVDPLTGLESLDATPYAKNALKPPFGEGIANNIRFRDGSIYQSVVTKQDGTFAFTELFPFFNWMVAEIDYARFKATGATMVTDAGGAINPGANQTNLWKAEPGSFGSSDPAYAYNPWIRLNPQLQADGHYYRTESVSENPGGSGAVLLEGMQTFLGQTNHIEWGKQPYAGVLNGPKNENGGIAGIVHYAITRAEDDPRYATAENWEPGIPRVQVNLYLDCDGDGKPDQPMNDGTGQCSQLSSEGYVYAPPDVDNYPFCWRDPESCNLNAGSKGPEDVVRGGDGTHFSYGDVFRWGTPGAYTSPQQAADAQLATGLGKTDGWDDSVPTGCIQPPAGPVGNGGIPFGAELDCFDGLYNFNQLRPSVFDGGYAFGRVAGQAELPVLIGGSGKGTYIVEAVAPPGYLHQGNGDKNVVFGDTLQASTAALPFPCVGLELEVPVHLTLFPGEDNPNYSDGAKWNKCDMKAVALLPGTNPAPDFFMFTEAPVAGHGVGFILDDTATEFNRFSPTFGEKYAPPHLPVSVQDWTGREISRVYSDQFGSYNFLVPSSFTINPPFPSGVMPSMMVSCMNHPGPITDERVYLADGHTANPTFGHKIIDPFFNRKYTQFCYTLQYLPGKTTYLDTPVLPIAAFANVEKNPLDCECQDQTPAIYSVNNPDSNYNNGNSGPWLPYSATASGTLTVVSSGSQVEVPNPAYDPAAANSPKNITRDYSFGSGGSVKLGGIDVTPRQWNQDILSLSVPAGTPVGSYQLTITRADNGRESVVGVTVHVGGRAPKVVQPGASVQAVIDNTSTQAGDLITIAPGTYNEYLILDKRVRLQGWGAGSVTINASKASAGGLAAWRKLLNTKLDARCGTPTGSPAIEDCPPGTPLDVDTGAPLVVAGELRSFDPLPGQTLGVAKGNNEPIFFGAEEGAGILAVGKVLPTANPADASSCLGDAASDYRIDGLTVTGSDAGGGILASGYNCHLNITNNRVVANYGTYGGGIRVGHTALTNADGFTNGLNNGVLIDHNWIAQNGASEIASGDGGGGGVTLGTGSNGYTVKNNYVCGNFSMSDGGGISHVGRSSGGNRIVNNRIVLNQTFNQSADPTGGGLFIGGQVALGGGDSDGTGDLTVDRNLIQYNHAGAGAGGGISITRTASQDSVLLTNNLVVNNATAYAGGGVAVAGVGSNVRLVNNTVADNVSTATNRQSFPTGNKTLSNPQVAGIARVSGSSPTLLNNIVRGNKAYIWILTQPDLTANPPRPVETTRLELATALMPLGIWDLGVVGNNSHTELASDHSVLSSGAGNSSSNGSVLATPAEVAFVRPISLVAQTAGDQPVVLPETTIMQTALTFDEGGNFINVNFSPLTPWDLNNPGQLRADYHLASNSVARNAGQDRSNSNRVPEADYDGDSRPGTGVDIGADEITAKADLAISLSDGVASAAPGSALHYSLVVTNLGPDSVSGAVLSDNRPAALSSWSWSCAGTACGTTTAGTGNINKTLGALAMGESVTLTIHATVSSSAGGVVVHSASVAAPAGVTDSNLTNNSATDSDTLLLPQANLSVVVSNGVNAVQRRSAMSYQIVVSNLGPNPVTGAVLTASEPTGLSWNWTCAGSACGTNGNNSGSSGINKTLATLAVNASVTLTATVNSVNPGSGQNTVSLTASVAAPNGVQDPVPGNNTATDTDPVITPSVAVANASGNVRLSGNTLDFGNNGGSSTVIFSVNEAVSFGATTATNTGGGTSSNPVNPTPYTLGGNSCTGVKAAGTTCQIQITFNAANGNTKTGTVSLAYTGGSNSPLVLNLTGN